MSKLDELIKELCPDGVEYTPISDLSRAIIPKIKIKSNDYLTDGIYPIIDQGQDFIGGYTNNEDVFPKDEYIIFGDHTCVVKFVDFSFAQGADGVKVLKVNSPTILPKYLFYCMANIKMDSSYARHWSKMKAIKIPVPHTDIQREIINILDNFTELTARKQQYEYYRDSLLSFGEIKSEKKTLATSVGGLGTTIMKNPDDWMKQLRSDGVVYHKLSDIAEYGKKRIDYTCIDSRNYVGVDNLLPNKQGKTDSSYVPKEGKLIRFVTNDILIGNIRPYLKKIWLAEYDGGTNGDVLVVHITIEGLEPKFLYYCLSSDQFFHYDMQFSKGAKMPRGDKKAIMEYKIPVPPLEIQYKVITVLDQFNSLTTDITDGLPAEIAARQQQYEYYRNKLLTFKEK